MPSGKSKKPLINLLAVSLLLALLLTSVSISANSSRVDFTDAERVWLAKHPEPVIWFTSAFMEPTLVLNQDGTYSGIFWEILQLVNEHLPIDIQLKTAPIDELLIKAANGELDGLLAFHEGTPETYNLLPSNPYLSVYPTLFSLQEKASEIRNYKALARRTVTAVKSSGLVKKIKKKAQDVAIIEVPDVLTGFIFVLEGKADAFVYYPSGNYLIEKHVLMGVVPAFVDYKSPTLLTFGVRKEWPELVSILNKALAMIPEEQFVEVRRKWFDLPRPKEEKVKLTKAQKDWLVDHPRITVHNEMN